VDDEAMTWARRPALEALDNFAARFHSFGSGADAMAMKQLMMITHRQGVVLAFEDVFLILTVLFAGLAFVTLVMAKPSPPAASANAH
jgi:MFS transporter, DHA2 family, multidrug resistance protein